MFETSKKSNGATAGSNITGRTPVATADNRYASPADILHAMLAEGWSWYELAPGTAHPTLHLKSNVALIVLALHGFEYVVDSGAITWKVVLLAWQEYGYYIGKRYMSEFGIRDSLDNVQ